MRTFLELSHEFVWTPSIGEEWRRHPTVFSQTWLAAMFARKRVLRLDHGEDKALRNQVAGLAAAAKEKRHMLKDLHLIEAALAADSTIVSRDENARGPFKNAARTLLRLSPIIWVNPTVETEAAPDWLRRGAQSEKGRQLGDV
jgi:hypothetical protein